MSALTGRTVVVTRPHTPHDSLVAALRRRGARALPCPLTELRQVDDLSDLDAELAGPRPPDWVVFASAAAVDVVCERTRKIGVVLAAETRIAAVGPATARALERHGITADAMPADHRGSAISASLGPLAQLRVLLPRSDIARDETIAALRSAGADVVPVTVYHTAPIRPAASRVALLCRAMDAIIFMAPSAVRSFAALLADDAVPALTATTVACIGPTTAAEVRALGASRPLTAPAGDTDALVALLEQHFAASRRPA